MIRRTTPGDKKANSVIGTSKSSGLYCRVLMLDGSEIQLEINKKTPGQWIFNHTINELNIHQKKYFGLLYEDDQKCQQWLDLVKPVRKQIKKNWIILFFCVRYYPVDPVMMQSTTKSQLYWQVKRDFVEGRLPCMDELAAQMCGYIAQVEVCDWLEPRQDYLITLGLLNPEFQNLEGDIIKQHKKFKGMTPINAMSAFLDIASGLEFYGMVFFEVKCEEKSPHILGLSPHGLALCKEFTIIQSYAWHRVIQVSYRGKHLTVKVSGEWAANSKSFNVHFDVDSIKICRDLYFTFIDYINFYKDMDASKFDNKGDAKLTIPSSISTEGLSQALLKSIEEEERKREKQRLHRSLSLPRKSQLRVTNKPHPLTTHTASTNDPVLTLFNSNRRHASPTTLTARRSISSSRESLDNSELDVPFDDTESVESHDSLLDLANDLGANDDEEEGTNATESVNDDTTILDSKGRCNSNPEMFSNSISQFGYHDNESEGVRLPENNSESLDRQRKKNRLLLQNWVTEQKKKTPAHTDPPVIMTFQSSPPRPYRLRKDVKSLATPTDLPIPLSYKYRPNSAAGNYQTEDLYSVPRASLAPSPYSRRPHPFSLMYNNSGSKSDLLSPSRGSSHNDYDIPRSLIDLRRVDSSSSRKSGSQQASNSIANARSDSSLTGQGTNSIIFNHKDSSLSSIPNTVDQAAYLKSEYPDYDVPSRIFKEMYPDYDIPRPHGSTSSESNLLEPTLTAVKHIPPPKDFGVLDSVMAEINDIADVHHHSATVTAQSLPSLIDENDKECHTKPKHVKENSTPAAIFSQVVQDDHQEIGASTVARRNSKESAYDRLSARIALERLRADGIIPPVAVSKSQTKVSCDKGRARSCEELVQDQVPDPRVTCQFDQVIHPPDQVTHLPTDQSHDQVPHPPPDQVIRPPDHLYDISKNFKMKSADNKSFLSNLPFDPNFFASQVEMEKQKEEHQLPSDVARFMSWVKTTNINTEQPAAKKHEQTPPTFKETPPTIAESLPTQKSSPPTPKHSPPTIKRSPLASKHSPPTIKRSPPTSMDSLSTRQKDLPAPLRIQEPIYQEINDKLVQAAKKVPPTPPPIDQLLASKPHTENSTQWSTDGKENKLVRHAAIQKSATLKKETSLPQIQMQHQQSNTLKLGGKNWSSFNTRRPLQIKLDKPAQFNDDESVPNSPSFYTKNPLAGTMPFSNGTMTQQDLREQLTQLDSSSYKHHHVAKWMKGAQKFWEGDHSQSKPPISNTKQKSFPPPVNSSKPLVSSQSMHSNIGLVRSATVSGSQTVSRPHRRAANQFNDHLYEDPDVLFKSNLTQRIAANESAGNHTGQSQQLYRPRAQTQARPPIARQPYVTRELQSTVDGGTVYATDV